MSEVQVLIDQKGDYNISINNQVWLRSSYTGIYIDDRWYQSNSSSLLLKDISYAEGIDPNLGSWNETQLNYNLHHNGTERKIVGGIRQWNSFSAITFHLHTDNETITTTVPLDKDNIRTIFPGFKIEQMNVNDQRGFFRYEG